MRLDLLPASTQPPLRDLFRRYVNSWLEMYRKLPNVKAAKVELARSKQLQGELWNQAIAAAQLEDAPPSAMMLLPALNQI